MTFSPELFSTERRMYVGQFSAIKVRNENES